MRDRWGTKEPIRWRGAARVLGFASVAVTIIVTTTTTAVGANTDGRVLPLTLRSPIFGRITFPSTRAHVLVVCFASLEVGTKRGTAEAAGSRGEAAVLVSLDHQYRRAVQVVIVAFGKGGHHPSASTVTNAYYDWHLGDIPLLADPKSRAASDYRVTQVPTTLVVTQAGRIVHRWDTYVPPGSLALAVQSALHDADTS